MERRYALSNGEIINVWYNDLGWVTVYKRDDKGARVEDCELDFETRSEDPVVVYNGEEIHLNNFCYTPYEELLAKVNEGIEKEDRWLVSDNAMLETCMRQPEKFGIVTEVTPYDVVTPIGIRFKSDRYWCEVLMQPVEDGQYKKKDWHYKMTLSPVMEQLREIFGTETTYTQDIFSGARCGKHWRLVDKEAWLAEHPDGYVLIEEDKK